MAMAKRTKKKVAKKKVARKTKEKIVKEKVAKKKIGRPRKKKVDITELIRQKLGPEEGLIPFTKGVSGNPKGRPIGSRTIFSNMFYKDMVTVWDKHGIQALQLAAVMDPVAFIRVAGSLLPKEFKAGVDGLRTLVVELIGASDPEIDKLEDLTSGGVMRPAAIDLIDGVTIEGQSEDVTAHSGNGRKAVVKSPPKMPDFEIEDEDGVVRNA